MLVWWHESRHKINYSHFFRGGWRGVSKWCNVRAHTKTISASTIDFPPILTYDSTSADLRQQRLTSFCAVWKIIWLQKGKHCGIFRGEVCSWHIFVPSQLSVCMQPFVTKPGSVMHHHEPECHEKRKEKKKEKRFYLQGLGHSMGLYNQNMMVSTIFFISCKRMSLLQPDLIWW